MKASTTRFTRAHVDISFLKLKGLPCYNKSIYLTRGNIAIHISRDVSKTMNGEWGIGFNRLMYIDVEMPHLSYMQTGLCRFNV